MASHIDKNARLRECHKIAKQRGGKCLSTKVEMARDNLEWKCRKGHQWKAPWHNIAKGTWCRRCAGEKIAEKKRKPFAELRNLAFVKGGKCLSSEFSDGRSKLYWECSKGHKFLLAVGQARKGIWCKRCSRASITDKYLASRNEKLAKLATKKGGRLIGTDPDNRRYVFFECKDGHRWRAPARHIIFSVSWCPTCAGCAKFTMDDVKRMAAKYGGQSLETEYRRSDFKMSWQCAKGHLFSKSVDLITMGHWCPQCSMLRRLLKTTKRLAEKHSGQCLSDFYEGPGFDKRVAIFECHLKHQWKMSHGDLKKGHWCPQCAKNAVLSKQAA